MKYSIGIDIGTDYGKMYSLWRGCTGRSRSWKRVQDTASEGIMGTTESGRLVEGRRRVHKVYSHREQDCPRRY